MDLGGCNTQTDPKKEESEGNVNECFMHLGKGVDNGSLWQDVQSRKELYLCPGKDPMFAPFSFVSMLQSYRPSSFYSLPKNLRSPALLVVPLHYENE